IRACGPLRVGPSNGVAADADVGEKDLLGIGLDRRPRLALPPEPRVELALRLDDHADAHPRVFDAAELAALALIRTRAAREEAKMVGDAGKHVYLGSELRDPETVDDIGRGEVEIDRCADRDVQLVRGLDAAVAELPPPLVAGGR